MTMPPNSDSDSPSLPPPKTENDGEKDCKILTDKDFGECAQFSLKIASDDETEPASELLFKFTDYAPKVFRELRERHWNCDVTTEDYFESLIGKSMLKQYPSPSVGKSGSFFYLCNDPRFIIKSLKYEEYEFFRRVLKDYYMHVKQNPDTLLCRFYGLHRVKLPHRIRMHFVVMNNVYPHRKVAERYDLKGSEIGRECQDRTSTKMIPVLKDLDWMKSGLNLELGPENCRYFGEQLKRDTRLLQSINVMDYSLLIGIRRIGASPPSDSESEPASDVVSPPPPPVPKATVQFNIPDSEENKTSRNHYAEDGLQKKISPKDMFRDDEGGIRARDENNQPLDHVYYLGIIDILTPYNAKKRIEHWAKAMFNDSHKISAVPSVEYGNRFFNFVRRHTKGLEKS